MTVSAGYARSVSVITAGYGLGLRLEWSESLEGKFGGRT